MLLRKLNSNNRQNRLYRAFRELGRVIRTLFLLRYLSESDLHHSIRAETTKIESYNDFLNWITFGGQVIKSGDPIEQTKLVKYSDLVANAIMLHNVSDLTNVLECSVAIGLLNYANLVVLNNKTHPGEVISISSPSAIAVRTVSREAKRDRATFVARSVSLIAS